jgi:ferredoxin
MRMGKGIRLVLIYDNLLLVVILARSMLVIKLIMKAFPGRFLIAKMTRLPLIGGIIDGMLFEDDDIIYLPQDGVIDVNKSFGELVNMVMPSQVVEHFIDKANYYWVMNWCICRKSSRCKHYPQELGCLFLGEAAMKIDPRLGHPVTKDEALQHIRKCRDAGLVQLVGRNKLDATWLDVSPGNKLLTICNCCPCCCLWRMLPDLSAKISSKVTKMPGIEVRVSQRCQGCGTCSQGICFVGAIHLENGHSVISEDCRGCGRCVAICPNNAIEILLHDEQYVEKSINRIARAVDVT